MTEIEKRILADADLIMPDGRLLADPECAVPQNGAKLAAGPELDDGTGMSDCFYV